MMSTAGYRIMAKLSRLTAATTWGSELRGRLIEGKKVTTGMVLLAKRN
jgi:hypothetical protein